MMVRTLKSKTASSTSRTGLSTQARLALICALTMGVLRAAAHEPPAADAPPPAISAAVMYRPTAMPDRIALTWSEDPTTTQSVTWRTSTDVSRAYAEIAVATAGPDFVEHAEQREAATKSFRSDLSKCHLHTLVFRDLQPGTRYVYRVGDGINWSPWCQFRTAAVEPEAFSFVYFGDAQNDLRSMWSRVVREAFADAPRAAFMLHAGDLVNVAERDAEWGAWFEAGGWVNSMIPIVATPGNHEYASRLGIDGKRVRWLSRHWMGQFDFPGNGPEDLRGSVYYLDYQNLRLISLNSNEKTAEQVSWLDSVLADTQQAWTIVTFHHPIYSTAQKRDNAKLRQLWKPVFDRHAVDLVLNGHDHTYGRTALLAPERNVSTGTSWRSDAGGTVYVVSVSGPKMYRFTDSPAAEFRSHAERMQLYQIVTIDGSELRFEARTATGKLHDAFTLCKRPGQPNQLLEQGPAVSKTPAAVGGAPAGDG